MPTRALPSDELQDLQHKSSEKADETLMCTRRMVSLIDEAKEAGIRTIVTLDDQGEQLEGIEANVDQINEDLSLAEKTMLEMDKCCGLFVMPCNKHRAFKDDDTWKGTEDGKVVNNQPHRILDDRNGSVPHNGGYIAKILNDDGEDEMEENMCYLNTGICNLKNMACDIGSELDSHNETIERINREGGNDICRIQTATKRTEKIRKI